MSLGPDYRDYKSVNVSPFVVLDTAVALRVRGFDWERSQSLFPASKEWSALVHFGLAWDGRLMPMLDQDAAIIPSLSRLRIVM
jgi:hypothetical protein